jgi:hypothetical protein
MMAVSTDAVMDDGNANALQDDIQQDVERDHWMPMQETRLPPILWVEDADGATRISTDLMQDDVGGMVDTEEASCMQTDATIVDDGMAEVSMIMQTDLEEEDDGTNEAAVFAANLQRMLPLEKIHLRDPEQSADRIFRATEVVRELNFLPHRRVTPDGRKLEDHLFNCLRQLAGVTIHTGNVAVVYPQINGPLIAGMGASAVGGIGLADLPPAITKNFFSHAEELLGPALANDLNARSNGNGIRVLSNPNAAAFLLDRMGPERMAGFADGMSKFILERQRAMDVLKGTFHPCLSQRLNGAGQVVSSFDLTTLDVFEREDADGNLDGDVVVVPTPIFQMLCENCAAVLYRTQLKERYMLGVFETAQRKPGDSMRMTWNFPKHLAMQAFACNKAVAMVFEFNVLPDLTLDGDLKIHVAGLPLLHRKRLLHVPFNKEVHMNQDGTEVERLPSWTVVQHPTDPSQTAHDQTNAVKVLTAALKWLPMFVHVNFWDDMPLTDDRP